ncbi:hypothetical protein D3C73_1551350 [compost metagenome]
MRKDHQHSDRHAERHMREQYRCEAQLNANNRKQDEKRGPDNHIRADDQHVVQREQRVFGPAAADTLNRQCADDCNQCGNR